MTPTVSASPSAIATKKFISAGWPSYVHAPRRSPAAFFEQLTINGNPADPASFEELHELIKAQAFRFANWRVASDDINYRRFFDTNDLAGICVENEAVFEATHRLVLSWWRKVKSMAAH